MGLITTGDKDGLAVCLLEHIYIYIFDRKENFHNGVAKLGRITFSYSLSARRCESFVMYLIG